MYERVRLLLEEFNNNGHAAAAIKGRLFVAAMEAEDKYKPASFYFPLVLDCLSWYCYHYYLTREIPGELELDSFRNVMYTLRELNGWEDSYDIASLSEQIVSRIGDNYSFGVFDLDKIVTNLLLGEFKALDAMKPENQ